MPEDEHIKISLFSRISNMNPKIKFFEGNGLLERVFVMSNRINDATCGCID